MSSIWLLVSQRMCDSSSCRCQPFQPHFLFPSPPSLRFCYKAPLSLPNFWPLPLCFNLKHTQVISILKKQCPESESFSSNYPIFTSFLHVQIHTKTTGLWSLSPNTWGHRIQISDREIFFILERQYLANTIFQNIPTGACRSILQSNSILLVQWNVWIFTLSGTNDDYKSSHIHSGQALLSSDFPFSKFVEFWDSNKEL